jgi:23S rRNA (guanosine2251-2'-O)-methyltransferase
MKYIGKPPRSKSDRSPRPPRQEDERKGRHSSSRERKREDSQGPEKSRRLSSPPQHQPKPVRQRDLREKKASPGPRPLLFGFHAVREAWLNPAREIQALYLTAAAEAEFSAVLEEAHQRKLSRPEPRIIEKGDFDRLTGRDTVHQGIALAASPLEEVFVQDIISIGAGKERSVILMLDQVTDPHNVGAILRSACAFGADGVIMQRRHAPELDGIVAKTASGAVEHLAVAYETNLSRALETLSAEGYTVIGLDEHADQSLAAVAVPDKAVLVLGAEGDGMRRLIREHCDILATLPTRAPIASLNVSNAAAVALYALVSG